MPLPSLQIPPPKLPSYGLPSIHLPIHIPFVGCAAGDGKTYVGKHFGNRPDFASMLHIKAIKKAMDEQVYALIEGQLPDFTRPPVYLARAIQIIAEVVEQIAKLNEIIGEALEEISAAVDFINQKKGELESNLNYLLSIPTEVQTEVQAVMVENYQFYLGDLNAQVGRLQSTIGCLTGL